MGDETELYRVLGRIEGKIDSIHIRQDTQAKDLDDVIKRVTTLEKNLAWWAGGAAAIGAAVGYILQVVKFIQ
jgi:hypothetical protein